MKDTITCPHCGEHIEVSEVLRKQVEAEVGKSLSAKHKKELEQARERAEELVRKTLEEEYRLEHKDLEEQLKEQKERIEQFREEELEMRRQRRKLEEEKKELALAVEKTLDEEREKIEEKALKQAAEEHHLKDKEKEKVIEDLKKALEEAQRKARQGSQQLQGEVLELDLESYLKEQFPQDTIEPVGKGVSGADVRQIVKSGRGTTCGVILWESKRTKTWSDKWMSKLKTDLRAEKAHVPIIVSSALPEEAENGMGLKDGVWVCSFAFVLPLATLVRQRLYDVAYQKAVNLHKGDKADLLYEYVTGHAFRQQVEALVEVFTEMQGQLDKERVAFEKQWKQREGQIRRLALSTANIYGSMQGLVGSSLPQVKGLDIGELESGE